MRFLIDAMFPPQVTQYLRASGHDALTPTELGAHNPPDDVLIQIATVEQRVIVTENASDFAGVTTGRKELDDQGPFFILMAADCYYCAVPCFGHD